jgi:predicted metal-dependent hydrolase
MPEQVINDFVLSKQNWIAKKLEQVKHKESPLRTYTEGENWLYLGKIYPLCISEDLILPVELTDKFCLAKRHEHHAEKVLTAWYRKEAERVITDRLEHWSELLDLHPASVRFSNAQRRWGSCSTTGKLRLNWHLIMAPPDIIDYVIVHELVHMTQLDHSKTFWQKVERILPDYKERRAWLRLNSHTLHL